MFVQLVGGRFQMCVHYAQETPPHLFLYLFISTTKKTHMQSFFVLQMTLTALITLAKCPRPMHFTPPRSVYHGRTAARARARLPPMPFAPCFLQSPRLGAPGRHDDPTRGHPLRSVLHQHVVVEAVSSWPDTRVYTSGSRCACGGYRFARPTVDGDNLAGGGYELAARHSVATAGGGRAVLLLRGP
jgi:hypothetical protein